MSSIFALNVREPVRELTSFVDRHIYGSPVDMNWGQPVVDAMLSVREFAKDIIRTNLPPFSVKKIRGVDALRPTALGIEILRWLPMWLQLKNACRFPWRHLEPSVQIVLSLLPTQLQSVQFDPNSKDITCQQDPNFLSYILNGFSSMVKIELSKALTQGVMHNFNAKVDEDYRQHLDYFRSVLKASPLSKIIQFELSMLPDYWKSLDATEDYLRRFLISRSEWEDEVRKSVGHEVIVAHSWRLQDTLQTPVIHSVMMLDGPKQEEMPAILDLFWRIWCKRAGVHAHFFNTCAESSPFLYRGMSPDTAGLYEKQNRLKYCAIYLARTQAWLRLEMNIELPFGRIGKLSKSQHLRIAHGCIKNFKDPLEVFRNAVVKGSVGFPWSHEKADEPPYGADFRGR